MLEVRGVSYCYISPKGERFKALKDINLRIRPGEFIALIGVNGSGKSTLAKLFNAMIIPSKGWVRVNGLRTDVPAHKWEIRKLVGMVFQNPENQIVASIVEEDVAFGPENLGLSRREILKRVNESLEAVGLKGYNKWPADALSGGQKQRVAIAGSIALKPDYLVLDEPTAMLDCRGRAEILKVLKQLSWKQGISVVLITHSLEEALLAERIILLDGGRIIKDFSPKDLFKNTSLLEELGVGKLPISVLAERLARCGFKPPGNLVTLDDMVDWICSFA